MKMSEMDNLKLSQIQGRRVFQKSGNISQEWKQLSLIYRKCWKANLILLWYKNPLLFPEFVVIFFLFFFFQSSPFQRIFFLKITFDWLLAERMNCNSIALNLSWTSAEIKKVPQEFFCGKFRYMQGFKLVKSLKLVLF